MSPAKTVDHRAKNRRRILYVIVIALMAVYAAISILDAGAAQQRLVDTKSDLDEIRAKLKDIERWQQAPKVAALRLESPSEIANRVAQSRSSAGIAQSSLLREEPTDPQRIPRTDFEIRTTTIELASTPLPTLLAFCEALQDEETGSLVRDIRLTAPRNSVSQGGQEAWEVELTLTQIIFSPTSR
ncbi:MAG: hypothetical protein AAGI63_07530 [Planctomycetota bacterium]